MVECLLLCSAYTTYPDKNQEKNQKIILLTHNHPRARSAPFPIHPQINLTQRPSPLHLRQPLTLPILIDHVRKRPTIYALYIRGRKAGRIQPAPSQLILVHGAVVWSFAGVIYAPRVGRAVDQRTQLDHLGCIGEGPGALAAAMLMKRFPGQHFPFSRSDLEP